MIATILPSSSDFHAVAYNEKKVANGSATLLEIKNFGSIDDFGYDDPEELVTYLKRYSSENSRVTKPQFHIAFSCKGDEMSYDELLDFAHKYLKEMGYGEDGQPLLVYAHNDTDNNHIHIITSRVDPEGRKIKHDNERRRSQKVIQKLLGQDEIAKLKKIILDIKDYNYRSLTQYRSILEAIGYECYEKNGNLNVKRGGILLASIGTELIKKKALNNVSSFVEPNYGRWYGIFSKYKDLNTDLEGFKKDLKNKFGLDLVFFGRKDSPYGYVVVDHNNKCVYEGSKIMNINKLRSFQTQEERLNKIDQYIYNTVINNPDITQKELNKKLYRLNAFIRNGEIVMGSFKEPLSHYIVNILNLNNKIAWVNSFKPQSADEFKLLLRFAGVDENNSVIPSSFSYSPYNNQLVNNIKEIFKTNDINILRDKLSNAGYRLITYNNKHYVYSPHDKSLISLERINLKLPQEKTDNLSIKVPTNNRSIISSHEAERGSNREWEVGSKNNWDEVDNGQQMKY